MTAPVAVDVLDILKSAAEREESRAGDLDGINAALCRMYAERMEEAHAAVAELIEDRRVLIEALRKAHYCGLMIGADCAFALARLQREGVYKPACSDGKPSRADASRDLEEIEACRAQTRAALDRVGGAQ